MHGCIAKNAYLVFENMVNGVHNGTIYELTIKW
jgi:hypothetical protein